MTRIVFIFKSFVIKIPNFMNGYKFILHGLLSNMAERDWMSYSKSANDKRLCPLLYCFPFGLFNVMKRAEAVGSVYVFPDYFAGLPYDPNANNIGLYNNQPVLIDYGSSIEGIECPKCRKYFDEIFNIN